MILQLTAKNCQIEERPRKYIGKQIAKLERMLPDVKADLVVLKIVIRRNIDRYHPPKVPHHINKSYADSKTALANFEGSITFNLNKNRIYTSFKGVTVDECLDTGFHRIFKEVEKYKDLHFSSDSEYPDHKSIRGNWGRSSL